MRNLIIGAVVFAIIGAAVWIGIFRLGVDEGRKSRVSASRAKQALQSGNAARALEMAKELLEKDPTSGEILVIAGESATKLSDYDAALGYYGQVPKSAPEKGTALWASGEILWHLGFATKTIDALQESIAVDPGLPFARERMIEALNTCGRRRETVPHVLALMAANRMTIENLIFLGNLAREYESPQTLEKCRAAEPADANVKLGLARLALSNGELDKAESLARQVVEKMPDLVEGHAQLGLVLLEQGDADLTEWSQALTDECSKHPDVWFVTGKWIRIEKPKEAIRCFAEAIRRDPNHLKAHQALAQTLRAEGQVEIAAEFATKADKLQRINIGLERIFKARNYPPTMKEVAELCFDLGRLWETMGWCVYVQSLDSSLQWPKDLSLQAQQMRLSASMPLTRDENNLVRSANWVTNYPLVDFKKLSVGSESSAVAEAGDLADIQFEDATQREKLEFQFNNNLVGAQEGHRIYETTGAGIAVLDFDLDAWPDIFFSQGGPFPAQLDSPSHQDALFQNLTETGNGFLQITQEARLRDFDFGQGAACGDVNGDGFDDIYVCNIGQNRLWLNCGDGTFQDASALIPNDQRWTSSAAIADIDFDGLANIYDANYVTGEDLETKMCVVGNLKRSCSPLVFTPNTDRLLTPTSDGTLQDNGEAADMLANSLGVVVFKPQNAELPSIFVSADQQANLLGSVVKSESGFVLQDDAIFMGLAYDGAGRAQACMGVAAGDVTGDGAIDFYVTNFCDEYYTLFVQTDGLFEDFTASSGTVAATKPLLGFGAQFVDAQLDGIKDLVVLNGHIDDHTHVGIPREMPPQLFGGLGNGKFELLESPQESSFWNREILGRSLVSFDFNRDGRLDLVAGDLEQPATLLQNTSLLQGKSLCVSLVGTQSDRNAICSIVTISDPNSDFQATAQLTGGSGYQASNQRILQFALPASLEQVQVHVAWPSGIQETHTVSATSAANELKIIESQGAFELTVPVVQPQ